jgi:hypothetical protein
MPYYARQVYDPLAYADQTGAMVSQVGRGITGTLGKFFEQNAQWKQFRTNQKNDLEAKQNFLNTTLSVLQERGINPDQIPGINEIRAKIQDKRITPEVFAETTAKTLEPLKEKLLFQKAKESFGAGGQKPVTDVMVGTEPTPQPQPWEQMPVTTNAQGQVVNSDVMATPQTTAPPQSATVSTAPEESPTKKYQKRMVDYYSDLADKGMLKAGDATKFFDIMAKLEHDENQDALTEKKAKIKAEEDERKALQETAGKSLISARISDLKIVSKTTGKEVDISPDEAMKHPELFAISKEHAQWKPSFGWGGGTGVPKNPDELKLQKAVIERLRQMNAGDFDLVQKTDAMGNIIPTYVPKPNSKSAQILSNPDWYNEFVTKFLPNYAKAVGITQPAQRTKGPGF